MVVDIVMDIGSSSVKIYKRGDGMKLHEPALALVEKSAKDKMLVLQTGKNAQKLAGDLVKHCVPVKPIKAGAVVDASIAAYMLRMFLERADVNPASSGRLRIIVPVNCGLTFADRKAIYNILRRLGAWRVYLVDGLLSRYSYTDVKKGFFVDIGGSVADVGYVSPKGIVTGCAADLAGDSINHAICRMTYEKYGLRIGLNTAELAKLALTPEESSDKNALFDIKQVNRKIIVGGRDLNTGIYRAGYIAATDLFNCAAGVMDKLVTLINSLLYTLPEEDYNHVCSEGIYLSGGTARMPGLAHFLAENLCLRVRVLKDIDTATARGSIRFYEEKGYLKRFLR